MPDDAHATTISSRVIGLRDRLRTAGQNPRTRRLLLLGGALVFVITGVIALSNLPPTNEPLAWSKVIVVALLLAPLTAVLSAAEYRQTARLVGADVSWLHSVHVSLGSSLANLLPLPGSYLLRSAALQASGVGRRSSITAPLGVGLAWIGVAGVLGGGWLIVSQPSVFAGALLSAGLALMALSTVVLIRPGKQQAAWSFIAKIWAIEAAKSVVPGARFFLLVAALNVAVSPGQGMALAMSSVLSTAVGVVPGGLGLREILAGAFAPLVALPASVGIVAAVINRIAEMVGLTLLSALMAAAGSLPEPQAAEQSPG